jgi:hypothetical protein
MKTRILSMIMLLMAVFSLSSCDKDTEGLTRVTVYPIITLEGGETVTVQKGTAYVEPGYTSTMNGEDVSSGVTVTGEVNTNKSGVYYLTYNTVKNSDGFGASATRKVVVLDLNDAIEGFYLNKANGNRVYGGKTTAYGSDYEILIINNGDGSYNVSDLFGGWYDKRADYGSAYAMVGDIKVAADGSVSLVNSLVEGWGDSLVDFSGTWKKDEKTFSVVAVYANGMTFNETWVKE